jgi:hypothetical protein
MADYRLIHIGIWDDDWFVDGLNPTEKVLWVYLFSNRRVSLCGLYRLRDATIPEETKLPLKSIRAAMARFCRDGKIQREGDLVWVIKLPFYQLTNSSALRTKMEKDLSLIPDCPIKARRLHYEKTGDVLPQPSDTWPSLHEEGPNRVPIGSPHPPLPNLPEHVPIPNMIRSEGKGISHSTSVDNDTCAPCQEVVAVLPKSLSNLEEEISPEHLNTPEQITQLEGAKAKWRRDYEKLQKQEAKRAKAS